MASKLFFSAILYLLSIAGFGQFNHIESKDQALEALNHKMADSNRQNLYNYLGKLYLIRSWTKHADIDSAFYYLRKAVYLSDSVNTFNNEITNESLCVLAQAYIFSGNYMVGKKICMQVIRNYQKYNQKMNEADTWRMMGEELWIRNSEDPFIQSYFDSAINLCDQMKQVGKKAAMRIKKINYFSATGKTETAEAELQKLLREAGENKFENLSEIYILLSYEERYKGNLNKGLEYSLEAVKYLDKAKDKSQVHNCYGELAQIYEELGEAEKSVYWYKKCIAERKPRNVSRGPRGHSREARARSRHDHAPPPLRRQLPRPVGHLRVADRGSRRRGRRLGDRMGHRLHRRPLGIRAISDGARRYRSSERGVGSGANRGRHREGRAAGSKGGSR